MVNKENEIHIPLSMCKHLVEISHYNHNYYLVPPVHAFGECNVVLEICNEDYDDYTYVLGRLDEGAFDGDENHRRFPSSYGFNELNNRIVVEMDRGGELNT